jgi:MFS family permease
MRNHPESPLTTLVVVCAAIVLVPISATGASLAVPGIGADLHSGLSATDWAVNAFFLTFAAFMAITGSLADQTGRRRMFIGGLALFSTAMLVAAAAPGVAVLIAGRALAGAGAAATTTAGSALLAQAYPGPSRTRAFAAFGTSIGVGLAFGPLVAGLLVGAGGWRLFFAVAGLVLLPVLAAARLLGESRDPGEAIDWAGAATFTAALSLLVAAIVEGPSLGWDSSFVIVATLAAVALFAAFVGLGRRSRAPMIDLGLLANARFAAICAMPVLLAFGFVALLIVLPPYFAAVDGDSAIESGLLLILLTGPTLPVPFVVGRIAHRVPLRALLITTMGLVAAGLAWLTVLRPGASVAALAGPLLTIGVGFGISLAVMDGAAISSVPASRAGMAAGLFNTARLTGEAVAVAVTGAVLAAVTRADLAARVDGGRAAGATGRLLQGDMAGALRGLGRPDLRAVAGAAYTDAMHVALWAIAGLMVLGALAVAWLTRPSRERAAHRGAALE